MGSDETKSHKRKHKSSDHSKSHKRKKDDEERKHKKKRRHEDNEHRGITVVDDDVDEDLWVEKPADENAVDLVNSSIQTLHHCYILRILTDPNCRLIEVDFSCHRSQRREFRDTNTTLRVKTYEG
jgi:hypothetical protein